MICRVLTAALDFGLFVWMLHCRSVEASRVDVPRRRLRVVR